MLKVWPMYLDNTAVDDTTLGTIQGMTAARNSLQFPSRNPIRLPGTGDVRLDTLRKSRPYGTQYIPKAAAKPQYPALPMEGAITDSDWAESAWQGWADKAIPWKDLAAEFKSATDKAKIAELASAAEAEAGATLEAVRPTVDQAKAAKDSLSAADAAEEEVRKARGNYATKISALSRVVAAETLWTAVKSAWTAAAKNAEGAAIIAAAEATAIATEKTQKLSAFEPDASAKTSAAWAATAKEWKAAEAELAKTALALSARTFSQVVSITTIGLFAGGVAIFAVLRFRRSTVTMSTEPLLTNSLV